MNDDIVEVRAVDQATLDGLKAWGWVSYILHLIVALAVVIPGAQVSVLILAVALVIDLVKRSDAQACLPLLVAPAQCDLGGHSVYRDRTTVAAVYLPGLDCVVRDLHLVPVSHRARHDCHEQAGTPACIS